MALQIRTFLHKIMNTKISPYFIVTLILAVLIINFFFAAKVKESCDTSETLFTSVNIKSAGDLKYVGFDLNKQNLTFGTLSPGSSSTKVVTMEYSKQAITYVWAEGDLSSWVIISPKKFEIMPNTSQDVSFTILAPITAKEGEYNGKIVFCYRDK